MKHMCLEMGAHSEPHLPRHARRSESPVVSEACGQARVKIVARSTFEPIRTQRPDDPHLSA
jgi:hypothetical protein